MVIGFLNDICKAIQVMHSMGIAHTDLKLENIFVEYAPLADRYRCILADMGLCQIVDESIVKIKAYKVTNLLGLTFHYAAPESLQRFRNRLVAISNKIYSVDIYAIAMIMFELVELRRVLAVEWQPMK
jgi:serine/threonine protein kinase